MLSIVSVMPGISFLINTILRETTTITYDVGLDAATVFNGMIAMVSANIVPILTLMGLALGMGWVIQYFNSARKGRIR